MIPSLNWQEITHLVDQIRPEIEGLFVERIIIPERERFPGGYLKGEWIIRMSGRRQDSFLLWSIFPRRPYLAWAPGKGPRASTAATHSPFEMAVSKSLKGAKLLQIEALPRERAVILWFTQVGESDQKLGLVLLLIPSSPEAFLVSAPASARSQQSSQNRVGWPILARSRTIRDQSKVETHFIPPDGTNAPAQPKIRSEFFEKPDSFYRAVEKELQSEAFVLRWQAAQKLLRQLIKQAQDRIRQSDTAVREAKSEEDWQRWGDLLKSALGSAPPLVNGFRTVEDYATEETVQVPGDTRLSIIEQVAKFYHNSHRKQRRILEAQGRIDRFQETLNLLQQSLREPPSPSDWQALEKLERMAGILPTTPTQGASSKKKTTGWLGKTFTSKDGQVIWVGRSKDENLELTFKHARGNDVWLHVRGRPGAHAVIPVQPGKSAPLETLLDAAHLVIHYSNGANWGKTEVDYTFKKYVKRIKDSSEASYTNNKTLLIQTDPLRLKRLLDQNP